MCINVVSLAQTICRWTGVIWKCVLWEEREPHHVSRLAGALTHSPITSVYSVVLQLMCTQARGASNYTIELSQQMDA